MTGWLSHSTVQALNASVLYVFHTCKRMCPWGSLWLHSSGPPPFPLVHLPPTTNKQLLSKLKGKLRVKSKLKSKQLLSCPRSTASSFTKGCLFL